MKVSLYPFLSWGSTWWEKGLKLLSLFCWLFTGGMYIYGTVEAFHWLLVFPIPNALCAAIWLTHFSIRLVSLWMPMGFLLVHWRLTGPIYMIVYVIGIAIAIIFSIVSCVCIADYTDEGGFVNSKYLREQFLRLSRDSFKSKGFQAALKNSVKFDSCCSWYGPTDFFESFEGMEERLSDNEFADGVASCYGGAFSYKDGKPGEGAGDASKITGCSTIYSESAARMMNYVILSAIVTFIVSPVFIGLFVYASSKLTPRRGVAPSPYQMAAIPTTSNIIQPGSVQSSGMGMPNQGPKSVGNLDELLPDY